MADRESRKRNVWAATWLAAVAIALVLAGTTMVLAIRQTATLSRLRIADLRPEAQLAVSRLHREVLPTVESLLMSAERTLATGDDDGPLADEAVPAWFGDLYVGTSSGLQVWERTDTSYIRADVQEDQDRIAAILSANQESHTKSGRLSPESGNRHVRFLADKERPDIVLAQEVNNSRGGLEIVVAAVVDVAKLRQAVLEPVLDRQRIEVIHLERRDEARGAHAWIEWLGPFAPDMALVPTQAFVDGQRSAVLRQGILFVVVAGLAFAALLSVVWLMWRVLTREVALSQLKQSFVADVSHELKTPLALIRLYCETLQSGRVPNDEKRQEYYEIITREANRLTHLIENILDFSRMEAGKKQYHMELEDVAQIARDTYEAYRAQLDHAGFKHEFNVCEDLPKVRCDRDAIAQAMINLINNAVKYAEDDKFLSIDLSGETRRDHHGVLISVSDEGIGISPEDRERLFGDFYRAQDDRVRKRRGTGLGLAVVKQIVDAHDGIVDVESRLVKGSTFRIFLPETNKYALGEVMNDAEDSDR